eukprot:UN04363
MSMWPLSWLFDLFRILFFDSEHKWTVDNEKIKYMDSLYDDIYKNNEHSNGILGIVIFDGICSLCNLFIEFVDKYDDKNMIYIGCLQNKDKVHPLLSMFNISQLSIMEKFAFIEYNKQQKTIAVHRASSASSASLNIMKYLSFP